VVDLHGDTSATAEECFGLAGEEPGEGIAPLGQGFEVDGGGARQDVGLVVDIGQFDAEPVEPGAHGCGDVGHRQAHQGGHHVGFVVGEQVEGVGVEVGGDRFDLTTRQRPVAPRPRGHG
jgi:hypothetical protein